ncbi:g10745 [Coccomyxa elongata]
MGSLVDCLKRGGISCLEDEVQAPLAVQIVDHVDAVWPPTEVPCAHFLLHQSLSSKVLLYALKALLGPPQPSLWILAAALYGTVSPAAR